MARCGVVVVGPTRLRLHHYSVVTNLSSNSCEGYNFPLFYFNKEEVLSMTVPTPGADFKILGKYFFSSFQLSRIVQFCAFTNFNHFLSVQKGFVSIETGASVKSDDLYHSEWINLAVAAVIVIWRIFIFVVLKMFALTGHVGGIFASEKWSENYFRLVDDDDPTWPFRKVNTQMMQDSHVLARPLSDSSVWPDWASFTSFWQQIVSQKYLKYFYVFLGYFS